MAARIATLVAVALLLAASPSLAPAGEREEANKKAVVEFYDKAINQKDFEAAAPYFGSRYVQHETRTPPTASRASRRSSGSCARSSPSRAARSSECSRTGTS